MDVRDLLNVQALYFLSRLAPIIAPGKEEQKKNERKLPQEFAPGGFLSFFFPLVSQSVSL